MLCGLVLQQSFEGMDCVPPLWQGTHTLKEPTRYMPQAHLDKALCELRGVVDHLYLERASRVFPTIYNSFMEMNPKRHNFMSYKRTIGFLLISWLPGDDHVRRLLTEKGFGSLLTKSRERQHVTWLRDLSVRHPDIFNGYNRKYRTY
jgi:hypothetical protein